MIFWVREILGWLVLLLGLAAFGFSGWLLLGGLPIQASTFAFAGFVIFRGGIHLLKVAVAARIALLAMHAEANQRRSSSARRLGS